MLGGPWIRPRSLFSKFLMGFCSDGRCECRLPAKFEVRSVTRSWDNRGYLKTLGGPWIRPRSIFSKIFNGLLFGWTYECTDQSHVCGFTRSWDNSGYLKILGSPWLRPRSLFSKIFNGLLFWCTLWMYRPNLKSVALPVPEIIRGT